MNITFFFYKLSKILKGCSYKRNFAIQLQKIVNQSEIFKEVYCVEDASYVITCCNYIYDENIKNKKLIIYSNQDPVFLNENTFNNKNVVLIIDHLKITNYTENYKIRLQHKSKRLVYLINNDIKRQTILDIPKDTYYKKTLCLLNISQLFKPYYKNIVKPLNERKYDLVFIGNTKYSTKEISIHRKRVIKKIIEISKKNKLTYFVRDKPLKKHYYLNLLAETKIFISPYGWGEWSLKDYECICNGVFIVKPKIYFKSYPNFYKNMEDFELDFSNFENKILKILKNKPKMQKMVNNNRELFLSYDINSQMHILEKKITLLNQ